MAKKPDLSSAEFEIMDVLWQKSHATVKEIQTALEPERKLSYSTISTLLARMKEKGYVASEAKNFSYEFRPLAKREHVVKRKLGDLVDRVLGGAVGPLAAFIVENRKLTPEQLKSLEEIIKTDKESK